MNEGIFINYRREDSGPYAGRLFDRLVRKFGRRRIFMDVANIDGGKNFGRVIDSYLGSCVALVALIGPKWSTLPDASGKPRIHATEDWVSTEIATALVRDVLVIPILVGGAQMPKRPELPNRLVKLSSRTALEISETRWTYDTGKLIRVIETEIREVAQRSNVPLSGRASLETNPFSWRNAISDEDAFENRKDELNSLKSYIRNRQNCQIVGLRRIGKSSLLREVQRRARVWSPSAETAYIDLQDPACATLAGWLRRVARELRWGDVPTDLVGFADRITEMIQDGKHPVLCLDEFGELTRHRNEFRREFFMTLRYCGQAGASIITASRKKLSEITDPNDETSPFFNMFSVLSLGPFSEAEAKTYVTRQRPKVPPFLEKEAASILKFAAGRPLALQIACFHVLETRENGNNLKIAMRRAAEDIQGVIER